MDSIDNESIKVPFMRTLVHSLQKANERGYKQNFKAVEGGLLSLETEKKYAPTDVEVVNFFRFEGISDPADNTILYIIETTDGAKGTLVDAYGAYSDPVVEKLMKQVKFVEKYSE